MSDYIKKLYKLAGIEDYSIKNLRGFIPNGYKCIADENNKVLDIVIDFTAEKQLELIKWLSKKTYRNYFKLLYSFGQKSWYMESDCISTPNMKNFENTLAGLVCKLWENLSEEQREEIKLILDTTKI